MLDYIRRVLFLERDDFYVFIASFIAIFSFIFVQGPFLDEITTIKLSQDLGLGVFYDVHPPFPYFIFHLLTIFTTNLYLLRAFSLLLTSIAVIYFVKFYEEINGKLSLRDKVVLTVVISLVPLINSTGRVVRQYSILTVLIAYGLFVYVKWLKGEVNLDRKIFLVDLIIAAINPISGVLFSLIKIEYYKSNWEKLLAIFLIFFFNSFYKYFLPEVQVQMAWLKNLNFNTIYTVINLPLYAINDLYYAEINLNLYKLIYYAIFSIIVLYFIVKKSKSDTLFRKLAIPTFIVTSTYLIVSQIVFGYYPVYTRLWIASAETIAMLELISLPVKLVFLPIAYMIPYWRSFLFAPIYGDWKILYFVPDGETIYVYPDWLTESTRYVVDLYDLNLTVKPFTQKNAHIKSYYLFTAFEPIKVNCRIIEFSPRYGYTLYHCEK